MQLSSQASGPTASVDRHGNLIVQVGADNGCVFTAHLDTVHRTGGQQTLLLVNDDLMADGPDGQPSVLGADDAAGIYILSEMILAGKPGTYMFFVGEEVGGIGSSAFVQDNPTFSANMAVAFDRRGTSDVITEQGGYGTCSTEFAQAVADSLNNHNSTFKYKPSDYGVYTDTKEFAGIVPECTNISVGYYDEHTPRERLNIPHLLALRDAVLATDWASLPIKRIPVEDDWLGNWNSYSFDTPKMPAYKSLHDRVEAVLLAHYTTLPDDVFAILSEIEEMLND